MAPSSTPRGGVGVGGVVGSVCVVGVGCDGRNDDVNWIEVLRGNCKRINPFGDAPRNNLWTNGFIGEA